MPKKGEYIHFKNYERKIKSPVMLYADFEIILVRKDNGKQNPQKSYTSKYQKHITCSYGNNFICAYDKISKPFKTYLGKDLVFLII